MADQRKALHGPELIGRFPLLPGHRTGGLHTAEMKTRQASKIRELAEAVEAAGFLTLDAQAKVLGVPRSTAWTIRRASHKASGLSSSIINRMLAAPELPLTVRAKILEYIQEKATGLYGGTQSQRRRFATRLRVVWWQSEPTP